MKIKSIINEISEVPVTITDNQVDQFCNLLNNTRHVFVSGAGRSGLMIKAFANRLLQLGYPVSVIGEVTRHIRIIKMLLSLTPLLVGHKIY